MSLVMLTYEPTPSEKVLYRRVTGLTSLPIRPNGISYAWSCGNRLIILSDGLIQQWCSADKLKSLPTLPESLKILWVDYNQLTSLPIIPRDIVDADWDEPLQGHATNVISRWPALATALFVRWSEDAADALF